MRALLAGATFQMPTLEGLGGGRNLAGTFDRMVGALQAQISIQAPRDTAPAVLTEVVDEVITQFEQASAFAFGRNPTLQTLLARQGEALRNSVDSLKLRYDSGLIDLSTFNSDAYMEIKELTLSRDVWPVGTPLQTYLVLAQETADDLSSVSTAVQASASLSQETAAAVMIGEATAFLNEVLLASSRQPQVSAPVVLASSTLAIQVAEAIGQPDFASRVALATAGFADALVNPGGTFGPGGSLGRRISHPPTVPDPLPIEDAATFTNLQYRQVETTSTVVLHRNFSSASNRFGRFMSTDVFASPAQAIRKLALDQSWYGTNQAYFVEDVTLPAGLTVYVGRVAPIYQGVFRREATPSLYPGGASQYLVSNTRAPGIVWDNYRATGT